MSEDVVLIGAGRELRTIAESTFREHVRGIPERSHRRDFMSADHDAVRVFAVAELGRTARAVSVERIADATALAPGRVHEVLADLERALLFLVRDASGSVSWAFPITMERTPHVLRYTDRPPIYAA